MNMKREAVVQAHVNGQPVLPQAVEQREQELLNTLEREKEAGGRLSRSPQESRVTQMECDCHLVNLR